MNKVILKENTRFFIQIFFCVSLIFQPTWKIIAQIGFKAGVSLSSFYYTNAEPYPYQDYDIDLQPNLGYDIEWVQTRNQKPLISPYLEFYYNYKISERFGIRPALCFTQRGVDFSNNDYEKTIYQVKINYLELPISISYKLLEKEKYCMESYFGASSSLKIKAFKKTAFNSSALQKTTLHSVKDMDYGIHLGLAYGRSIFNKTIHFDTRIFVGLNSIFIQPEDWINIYFNHQKTKITGIILSIAYDL